MAGSVTNKDIMTKLDAHGELLAGIAVRLEKVDEHHKTLYGNGQPGLVKEVDRINTTGRTALTIMGLVVTVLTIMQALTGCTPTMSPPQQTASALNATYEAAETPEVVPHNSTATPTATATASPTPTATLTPCCGTPIVTVTPHATVITTAIPGIYEVTEEDVQILSRLCATESRGFVEMREQVCWSILDTVFKRMALKKYSDGTLAGTIGWNCGPDTLQCHYPASVLTGCEGFKPGACWWDFTDDVRWFEPTIWRYFFGERGRCPDFLNYGSRDSDMGDCVITASNGQKEGFFNEDEN